MSVESKRVSAKQLRANRRNAQRSTGPRTEAGKARSAKNATTHGTFCADLLLPGEDEEELRALQRGIYTSFSPQDFMERELVDRIVAAQWRLRRLRGSETEVLRVRSYGDVQATARQVDGFVERYLQQLHEADHDARLAGEPETVSPALALAQDFGDFGSRIIDRLSRYQQRLEQSVHRASRELRQLRNDRREMGELPPCPYLEELKHEDEPARGVVASATTSDESMTPPIRNVQNEPISEAPRAADGADDGCDQASQDVVIIERVKLGRATSNEARARAEEGPISPGA
jgi:hypothetical protein